MCTYVNKYIFNNNNKKKVVLKSMTSASTLKNKGKTKQKCKLNPKWKEITKTKMKITETQYSKTGVKIHEPISLFLEKQ